MKPPLYALVAYVKNPVGQFVEALRRELHPEHPDWPAHITLLPPRTLQGSESAAIQRVHAVCETADPFEVTMGDVETFAPSTATVFIRVAHAAYRVRELHDKFNTGPLAMDEPWPYMPHLTIAKLQDTQAANHLVAVARERWAQFKEPRRILIDQLTFVREGNGTSWEDLAPFRLGSRMVLR